jgi:hypothetical protein
MLILAGINRGSLAASSQSVLSGLSCRAYPLRFRVCECRVPAYHKFNKRRSAAVRPLSEQDAVDLWIARWLRVRPSELVRRYACDPRRIYEIWEEARFPGSRAKALTLFRDRYPGLDERIDPGPHRRIPASPGPGQMNLFADF